MRAVTYTKPGPAGQVLRLSELPDPEPGPGQVRVRICFSGVNPTDWKRRSAEPPKYDGFQVPHQDGSGVVDRVGAGVNPDRLGQSVWVYHSAIGHAYGTAAEFLCIPERQAVPLPSHVSLLQGATLGIPYLTAAHALSFAPSLEGLNILVQGGAGAVGYAAIQLARSENARVVTTVSGDAKAELAGLAGPHVILNYRSSKFLDHLKEASGTGFDLVTEVDLGFNLPTYAEQLALDAHVAAYASDGSAAPIPPRVLMFRNAHLHFFVVYLLQDRQIDNAVAKVQVMLDDGVITALPINEYEFGHVARAHDAVEGGLVGRAVIRIE